MIEATQTRKHPRSMKDSGEVWEPNCTVALVLLYIDDTVDVQLNRVLPGSRSFDSGSSNTTLVQNKMRESTKIKSTHAHL